jgi:hypothetical protein
MHEPTLVAALVTDNHGNRAGDLFRGDVEARGVQREIAVKVPAHPYVTKFEGSREATAHLESRAIGDRWHGRFFGLFLLRFFCDRLRRLYDLACTPK